jgi:hypothetical protein
MAIKTFSVGEVLTASDTNTYLANSGLVYVTSTTFTGSSSVSVNDCFTSTYARYRLHFEFHGSTATAANLRMRASGTDSSASYYLTGYYSTYSSTTLNGYALNNGAQIAIAQYGTTSANATASIAEIMYPQLARNTSLQVNINDPAAIQQYTFYGLHAVASAYDGFTVFPSAGTITGSITVFGYRTA